MRLPRLADVETLGHGWESGLKSSCIRRAAIWLSSADLAPQRKEKPRKRRKKKSLGREPQHETDPKTEPCDRPTPNTAATSLSHVSRGLLSLGRSY